MVVVLKKQYPCKVVAINRSQPGKHGAAKQNIIGLDIFTGKKHEDTFSSSEEVRLPDMLRDELQVIGVNSDEGTFSALRKDGTSDGGFSLPDDTAMRAQIEEAYGDADIFINVLSCMDNVLVRSVRVQPW
eukprot:TRINITY_DN270_c0_g1_i1.p2 TRINITY_DN270_c0_g1~~TRINITY_DN270_c0_g1_i1.p2  ORF type:complete len:130 (-),score=42.49 TRINITY_DN270_c0_g1_i1:513-902(-)